MVEISSQLEDLTPLLFLAGGVLLGVLARRFIRFHTFGDSGIRFTWVLRGREFADQDLLKHEAVKRLERRFRQEGIEIPYPTRSVLLGSPGKSPGASAAV